MNVIPILQAQSHLAELLANIAVSHEAVRIQSEQTSAVLISEADWRAIQETLYLLSIPGMRESIREGLAMPMENCESELDW